MFQLTFILMPDFEQSKFKMSRAKYQTESYTAAILLVEAFRPMCQDFTVSFSGVKYTPTEWSAYVHKMQLQNGQAKEQELFFYNPENRD